MNDFAKEFGMESADTMAEVFGVKIDRLALYWEEIPIGRENAVTYDDLRDKWNKDKRTVRRILHDLSCIDTGDNYVLIRSGKSRGFYKTDDLDEIAAYRKECLNKGRSIFAPVKKCNRILNANGDQMEMFNSDAI